MPKNAGSTLYGAITMIMQNEGIHSLMCPKLNQHIYLSFYNTRKTLFVIIDAIL